MGPLRLKKGDFIALYCTKPISKIVAYVEVYDIIKDTPKGFGLKRILRQEFIIRIS